jgi:hypothetical protein
MPRFIERVIAPAVGLANEAIAHHRAKSRSTSPNPQLNAQSSNQAIPQPDDHDANIESDEELWELDDAAEEVAGSRSAIPQGNWVGPASIDEIVNAFLETHPVHDVTAGSRLSVPVVIPQKRPQEKSRGFVRAYAPILEECNISQATWFAFLDSFHQSIKVCLIFQVLLLTF